MAQQIQRDKRARCQPDQDLESENLRLKKLPAEQLFENDLIKDALQKKW